MPWTTAGRSQARPPQAPSQMHTPLSVSHLPCPEQLPPGPGQRASSQCSPANPGAHSHTPLAPSSEGEGSSLEEIPCSSVTSFFSVWQRPRLALAPQRLGPQAGVAQAAPIQPSEHLQVPGRGCCRHVPRLLHDTFVALPSTTTSVMPGHARSPQPSPSHGWRQEHFPVAVSQSPWPWHSTWGRSGSSSSTRPGQRCWEQSGP
mmetsp:Transcript_23328/g.88493  ORF Transcript_23328/g.88493 Transcript_23328/m.88493 type:complete len:203 (-) Transcript_23328:1461-2069(-)